MAAFYVRKNASGNGVFSTIEEARDAVRALIAAGLTEPVTVTSKPGNTGRPVLFSMHGTPERKIVP